jgi:predicted RND superfamily exporter protein
VTAILADIARKGTEATLDYEGGVVALSALRKALSSVPVPPNVRMHVTGSPVIGVEGTTFLLEENNFYGPIAMLIIIVSSYFIFRSKNGVILVVSSVAMACIWVLGLFPFFHRPWDIQSSVVPTMILIYGAVDPIFVLARFLGKKDAGLSTDQAISESYAELILPCFLTSLTTAMGFFSFATLTLPSLVMFGVATALGVTFAFVSTVTAMPLLLSWLSPPAMRLEEQAFSRWLDKAIVRLWSRLRMHLHGVAITVMVILIVGGLLASRQTISYRNLNLIPAGKTRDSIKTIDRKLSGVSRSTVLLEGPPGSMKRPEVLRAIAAIDETAGRQPFVTSSLSLADVIGETNQAIAGGGDPAERRIPESPRLIAQYLAIMDPEDRADFVNADYSITQIRISAEDQGSHAWRELNANLEPAIEHAILGLGIRSTITGYTTVYYTAMDRLAVEMILGFVIGFTIIVLFQLIIFRSWRIALLSIIPNLLPTVACFAILAAWGVPLQMGTLLVLSVCIGGLFNTTIHLSARMLQRLQEGSRDFDEIIEHSLRKVTPPSLFTAGILGLGFAVFLFSRFPDMKVLGALSVTVLWGGFFSDLIVTPVLLRLFFNWQGTVMRLEARANKGQMAGTKP